MMRCKRQLQHRQIAGHWSSSSFLLLTLFYIYIIIISVQATEDNLAPTPNEEEPPAAAEAIISATTTDQLLITPSRLDALEKANMTAIDDTPLPEPWKTGKNDFIFNYVS